MLKTKSFIALLLVFVLAFGGASAAFAQTINKDGAVVSDVPDQSVQAAITKVLQVPVGTAVPDPMEFNFIVTPKTVDGVASNGTNMPDLNDAAKTVTYPGGTQGASASGNTTTYSQQTPDIFENVSFPHAGVYVYTIEEEPDTYTGDPTINEVVTYSGAVYTLTVFVANKSDGSGTYIQAVGSKITTKDNPGQNEGDKVDPTPGTTTTASDFSKMVFTNTYVKTNSNPDDPDPANPDDATLTVSKTVDGDAGDKTLPFTFAMTVNAPEAVYMPGSGTAPSYDAYIMEGTSQISGPIAFTSGVEQSFQLTHGQKLVFVNTPVGTSYATTETGTSNYKPSANIVTADHADGIPERDAGDSLATGLQLVGEPTNSADFTNTYNFVSATGIIMNHLPFISVIALAIIGLGVYITLSIRKRNRAAAQA